jgi:hypothetical protein
MSRWKGEYSRKELFAACNSLKDKGILRIYSGTLKGVLESILHECIELEKKGVQ